MGHSPFARNVRLGHSPFVRNVRDAQSPRDYKEVNFSQQYNGQTDPMSHLIFYQHKMTLYAESEEFMCKNFPTSLGEAP